MLDGNNKILRNIWMTTEKIKYDIDTNRVDKSDSKKRRDDEFFLLMQGIRRNRPHRRQCYDLNL